MIVFICLILFIFCCSLNASQQDAEIKSHEISVKLYHLVLEQFYTGCISYPFIKNGFIEAEYGYYYYHRAGINLGYKFNFERFCPYIMTGSFYIRENYDENNYYEECYLKFGGGIESNLTKDFFMNLEVTLQNCLITCYNVCGKKYRNNYELGHTFNHSISIGFGYHFHI